MTEVISDDMRRTCFFCSKFINEKKTEEHIIPNSLLGKLGIKEETLVGQGKFQYSRLKVPAHSACNSGFGSRYENEILSLLDSPDKLLEDISENEDVLSLQYQPSNDSISLVTTWLSKIYYGIFYNDYLKVDSPEWNEVYREIIDCDNFKMIQKSYQENQGFSLPSSLFAFKTNDEDFDLRTFVHPQAILIKIKKLVLILCIGDGYLTKAYLNKDNLKVLQQNLDEHGKLNPHIPQHLIALADILAFRHSIPKTPKFIYSDKFVVNMSLSSAVKDPHSYYKIDEQTFIENKKDVLANLNIILQ